MVVIVLVSSPAPLLSQTHRGVAADDYDDGCAPRPAAVDVAPPPLQRRQRRLSAQQRAGSAVAAADAVGASASAGDPIGGDRRQPLAAVKAIVLLRCRSVGVVGQPPAAAVPTANESITSTNKTVKGGRAIFTRRPRVERVYTRTKTTTGRRPKGGDADEGVEGAGEAKRGWRWSRSLRRHVTRINLGDVACSQSAAAAAEADDEPIVKEGKNGLDGWYFVGLGEYCF